MARPSRGSTRRFLPSCVLARVTGIGQLSDIGAAGSVRYDRGSVSLTSGSSFAGLQTTRCTATRAGRAHHEGDGERLSEISGPGHAGASLHLARSSPQGSVRGAVYL